MSQHHIASLMGNSPFVISAEQVFQYTKSHDIRVEDFLNELIPYAQTRALPTISGFKVGVAILGKSGAIYLGVNLEFPGMPLNASIHAEQFAITLARAHGETGIVSMAVSAAPCGHCRQFLNEIGHDFQIVIPHVPMQCLSTLLPQAFRPQDLGFVGNLMSPVTTPIVESQSSLLHTKAIEAALLSYAPYSRCRSGVAIQLKTGEIYQGSSLENAAYNPSVQPLQAALITLIADQRAYADIEAVALAEQNDTIISYWAVTQEILRGIAPGVLLSKVFL